MRSAAALRAHRRRRRLRIALRRAAAAAGPYTQMLFCKRHFHSETRGLPAVNCSLAELRQHLQTRGKVSPEAGGTPRKKET